jgi:hypothetical protein
LREKSVSSNSPFGVSYLALLIIVQGFIFIPLTISSIAFSYMNGYLNAIQIVGSTLFLICCSILILLGNGMFDMKRWAWFGSVGYVFLLTMYSLYTGIIIGISANLHIITYTAITIGYLAHPDIRNQFS